MWDGTGGPISRRAFLTGLAAVGLPMPAGAGQVPGQGVDPSRYTSRLFPPVGQPAIDGVRHEVYSAGPASGPRRDVIVLHEITGARDLFFAYVDTLLQEGFTVHCPVFFGRPFERPSLLRRAVLALEACSVFSEFECMRRSAYAPINPWLVALAVDIAGGEQRKVGVIGMCLTGIQPLAMLRCRSVVAPVLCQPTLPTGRNVKSARDFGLPPSDFDFAHARVHTERLDILLIRYKDDKIASALRAARLAELLKPRLEYLELEGHGHSSLVTDPDPAGLARTTVVRFLRSKL
jgi:dienelactone hydrolase